MDECPAEAKLAGFLARFTPEVAELAEAVLGAMRARLPGAVELVYDNYNALAIGFAPTERMSDTVFSIAVFPSWVSLFFFRGAELDDPQGILRGSGNQARHIRLTGPETLDEPSVRELMRQALERAPVPIDTQLSNRIVIKSVSARQRPRRPS